MQERCSAGLGAPMSWVRRDRRRQTHGRVDPGAGSQSGPLPVGFTAVPISGEVAADSRDARKTMGGAHLMGLGREVLLALVAGGLTQGWPGSGAMEALRGRGSRQRRQL